MSCSCGLQCNCSLAPFSPVYGRENLNSLLIFSSGLNNEYAKIWLDKARDFYNFKDLEEDNQPYNSDILQIYSKSMWLFKKVFKGLLAIIIYNQSS